MTVTFQKNISLKNKNSWSVGGEAEFFGEPTTVDELREFISEAQKKNLELTILGGGTNILVSDAGVQGLVLSLGKLSGIEILEEGRRLKLWAMAGTPKSELLKQFLRRKLEASLFLAGLPGQVGGGVVMNAGVSEQIVPREFCDITDSVEVLRPDGSLELITADKLKWDYRHCDGWQPGVVVRVLIDVEGQGQEQVPQKVRELNQLRFSKQPLELPSCGSVFRNPLPHRAGQLIEEAGLKGTAIGGAQISPKHANFIVNNGGATASDIWQLMNLAISRVREKFAVELKSEVVWVGRRP
jgi:UDP-N-acetylmuramate dehydrogenase